MNPELHSPSVSSSSSSPKRVILVMILTILVCVALVSIYMPRMILWYYDPPMPTGISCTESIRGALEKLQKAQIGSLVVGVILGFVLGWKFRVKKQG